MRLLRDRWRRTAFARYFENLPAGDRATFWIVAVLALALAISLQKIFSQPILTTGGIAGPPAVEIHYASCGDRAC